MPRKNIICWSGSFLCKNILAVETLFGVVFVSPVLPAFKMSPLLSLTDILADKVEYENS